VKTINGLLIITIIVLFALLARERTLRYEAANEEAKTWSLYNVCLSAEADRRYGNTREVGGE
jgi:hypothetical protein